MKKSFLYTLVMIFISFIFIFTVQLLKGKNERNGFKRSIRRLEFKEIKVFKLPSNLFYFAGQTSTKFYLKDVNNPRYLFDIDYNLNEFKKIDLKLGSDTNVQAERINMGLEKNIIYINNNKIGDLSLIPLSSGKKISFENNFKNLDQPVLISETTLIGRDINFIKDEVSRELIKFNFRKKSLVNSYLLKKQVDGFFCTDGILKSDPKNSRLIYMYFYRGEFLCLDTNLKLLYKGITVDTNRIAKIKMAKFANNPKTKEKVLTQASPPLLVNRNFTIANNNIYVISALKSDDETSSDFRNGQIIDVYSSTNGIYIDSFYIPKYKGKKITDFKVIGKNIFAIFDKYIVKFNKY